MSSNWALFGNDNGAVAQIRDFASTKIRMFNDISLHLLQWYRRQSKAKQTLVIIGLGVIFVVFLVAIWFRAYLVALMVKLSDDWKEFTFGKLILFALIFMVGFPPILGFSALSMLCGMVYGFPYGWPLLASASVSGSFCSFILFRYILHERAVHLINGNENFRAFSEILRDDNSLFLLCLIRLCPLPYSLSNGALAAIPELSALTYFLASVLTSPKLFIHLFVGYKIKELGDDTKSHTSKVVDIVSILITAIAASITTYIIYSKMQRKLQIYHLQQNNEENYEAMIFGNFDDDVESGNIELNSREFDVDNVMIDDNEIQKNTSNPNNIDLQDFEIGSDDDLELSTGRRDY
jgi:uncharacterized membrane protein YdjX (TVP38/TMEM64 family)